MKFKRLINLALFIALGFSVVHEYASAFHSEEHSHVTEYVTQFSEPSEHHDSLCDVHAEYHQSFLASEKLELQDFNYLSSLVPSDKEAYTFKTYLHFFKPPIV